MPQNKIMYLVHQTAEKTIEKILSSGQIYTSVDLWFHNIENKHGFLSGSWSPTSLADFVKEECFFKDFFFAI